MTNSSEKLTLQDLVDRLADKQGMTKKDVESFLRELINLTTETLESKDFVRIRRFGTFKLTEIKARKSIDVNTNQTIEIPAHYRLGFVPDKELRDTVNKPFAHFKSELISDDTPLDAQEQDVIISALDDEKEQQKKEKEEIVVERIVTYPKGVEIPNNISLEDLPDDEFQSISKKKRRYLKPILLVSLLLLCSFGLYYALESKSIRFKGLNWTADEQKMQDQDSNKTKELAIQPQHNRKDTTNTTVAVEEQVADEPLTESEPIAPESQATAPKVEKETPEIDTNYQETEIRYGDTLRKLGAKYYGHRSFWVYIYEENKDKIKDPNSVPIGTKLRIAPPSKYNIDAKDSTSRQKAMQLEGEIFKKFDIK